MKKDRVYPALMTALVILIVALFGWILYREWQERRLEDSRRQEDRQWRERAEELARKVARLEEDLKTAQGAAPADEERFLKIFGPPAAGPAGAEQPASVEAQVLAFFRYLDGRDYIQAQGLEGGTHAAFARAIEELTANPPQVVRETDSLIAVIRNASHFFRVLGKQRVLLAAQVLQREEDLMEPAMRFFYRWAVGGPTRLSGRPDEETLYRYASFFTETLGGRSYVARRGGRLGLLVRYYCILVFDRAYDRRHNPYGVDIRPLIAAALPEMRAHRGLIFRPEYLAELERLARKYDVPAGG